MSHFGKDVGLVWPCLREFSEGMNQLLIFDTSAQKHWSQIFTLHLPPTPTPGLVQNAPSNPPVDQGWAII